MDLDTLSEAAAALRAAAADSLAEVAAEATRCAQAAGLRILPASLDFDSTVVLDHKQMIVQQVVTAAASSGTTLLYVHRRLVDERAASTALGELDCSGAGAVARRALLKELQRVAGWTVEVEVGFAHQGVMNVWAVVASWADDLDQVMLELRQPSTRGRAPIGIWGDGDDEESPRLDDAAVTRLAGQLAAVPKFRRATRSSEREAAARQVPELANLLEHGDGRWQVPRVMREAVELVQDQVASCIDRLKPHQDDLVSALAADEEFCAIRTVDARQKYAQTWSLEHTDGLRMPGWWIKELVAATRGTPAARR